MNKIKNWKQFNEKYNYSDDAIYEKWYHNLLAGLMMIMPSVTQAAGVSNDKI